MHTTIAKTCTDRNTQYIYSCLFYLGSRTTGFHPGGFESVAALFQGLLLATPLPALPLLAFLSPSPQSLLLQFSPEETEIFHTTKAVLRSRAVQWNKQRLDICWISEGIQRIANYSLFPKIRKQISSPNSEAAQIGHPLNFYQEIPKTSFHFQKLFLNYAAHFLWRHAPGTELDTELILYFTLAEGFGLRGQGKAEQFRACCAAQRSQKGRWWRGLWEQDWC